MSMNRRKFFASALFLGATAKTPAEAELSSDRYEVSVLPPDTRAGDGPMIFDPPLATRVEFVDKGQIGREYQEILANFAANSPSVDLMDPASYLIVRKPKHAPEGIRMAECQCLCGPGRSCTGSGHGGSNRAKTVN